MLKIINKIEDYIILGTVFLYPIFVTTLFPNIFESSKFTLLSLSLLVLSVIKLIKLVNKRTIEINRGKFDLFAILFAGLFLISTLITSVNKLDAFLISGNAGFVILGVFFYFYINQKEKEFKDDAMIAFISSAFIMAVYQIFNVLGIIKLIPFIPEVFKSPGFNLVGNISSLFLILLATIPLLLQKIHKNEATEKVLAGLVTIVIISGISLSIFISLPNKETAVRILDWNSSWIIAVDSMKESPILGTGPTGFLYAFNKFRPLSYNSLDNWDNKFLLGSSLFMTVFVEVGIIGILLLIFLLFLINKNYKFNSFEFYTLNIIVLSIMFLPISFSSFPIIFALMALLSKTEHHKFGEYVNKIPQLLIFIPSIILLVLYGYFVSKVFYAENIFLKSMKELNNNQAVSAYDLVNKAIKLNPYSDRFHLYSSTLNFALAESLAKKDNPTEEDKNNISGLIQQSIREGKASVAVNTRKSSNWESLSDLYRSMMSFAKEAEKFAIESLKQAISLDPINPKLRIKLGSLYYSLGKYEDAIDVLKLSVIAKPDYPNSRYNLALAYKANKQVDKAKEQMNIVLSLLGKDSKEYEVALKEIQDLENLTEPEPLPEPVEPQVEIEE